MTKVLKLLGGGWLAAVLGIVLFAAFSLFSNDSGTTSATPNFDRASAHFIGADLAPASLANNANPIRYLPGDINATITASAAVDAKGTMFANALARDMTSNTVNVSRGPDAGLTGASNIYTLNSRWSLITWADAGINNNDFVKGTDVSDKNLGAQSNTIVTAIYGYDAHINQYTQIFPSTVNVLGANDKMTLDSGQAHWIVMTTDPNSKGIRFGNLAWADTADNYTAAIERARGDTVQFYDPFISAVVAGDGLVLDNGTLNTNTFGAVTCNGVCDSLVGDIAAATRTGVGMTTSIIRESNVLEDANFFGSMAVFDGDVAGSGQYFGVHAMDPVGTLDIGTTVGNGTIAAPIDYPKASTSLVNAIESWKNYQLLTMNSINDGIAQLLGVGSDSHVSAGDSIISGISESNGTGVSSGSTHEAWYQAISTTALSNSAFLVLGLVALFAAAFVAMWTSDGFVATNHRAVRAIGAG